MRPRCFVKPKGSGYARSVAASRLMACAGSELYGDMIHLRLIVPSDDVRPVLEYLETTAGVAHMAHMPDVITSHGGDLVLCDVAREAANEVVEWLQRRGIHHRGAIIIESLDAVISDAAAVAEDEAPGQGTDALIWEELEARTRTDAVFTVSFGVLISIAAIIAGAGILSIRRS